MQPHQAGGQEPPPAQAGKVDAPGPRLRGKIIVVPAPGPKPSARRILRAELAEGVAGFVENGVSLLSAPTAAAGAAAALRRLRSVTTTFAPLLAEGWGLSLAGDLEPLAESVAGLEASHLLAGRVAAHLPTAAAAQEVAGRSRRLQHQAHQALTAELLDESYDRLLERMADAAADPPTVAAAGKRAKKVMTPLLAAAWKAWERKLAAGQPDVVDLGPALADGGRVEDSVTALVPAVGKPARKLGRAVAAVVAALAEERLALETARWSAAEAAAAGPEVAFLLGRIAGREESAARAARVQWQRSWQRARRPQLRWWL